MSWRKSLLFVTNYGSLASEAALIIDQFGGRNLADIIAFAGIPNFLGGLKAVDF